MKDINIIKKDVARMTSDTFHLDADLSKPIPMRSSKVRTAKEEAVYQDRLKKLEEFNNLNNTEE